MYFLKQNGILNGMKMIFRSRIFFVIAAIILVGIVSLLSLRGIKESREELVTTTVTRGDVLSIISVSGIVESEDAADLAFPLSDIVEAVNVDEGDHVVQGEILATLARHSLLADRNDALGSLTIAKADRDELIEGPTSEARDVTQSNVAIATENLIRVQREQDEIVENALRTLFSDSLEAIPERASNSDTPPTISGTYTCTEGITYTFTTYPSESSSGYSYRIPEFLNEGRTAHTESAQPFGDCGLLIRFATNTTYGNSTWTVTVPNVRGINYSTNLNAYELALQQRDNKIEQAEQELELAINEQELENATPREEALARANAKVLQAEARLAVIDASIEDRILRAPFDGVITDVTILPGEISGTLPIVTMVSDNTYELTVRIPEIDITKITEGDVADVIFDARTSEVINSKINFISPLGTEIDGVAYYEGHLEFETPPEWLRSGLNADVDIVTDGIFDVPRLPRRFLEEEDGAYYVHVVDGDTVIRTQVEAGFVGNNGFIEVRDLEEGTKVAAPPEEE